MANKYLLTYSSEQTVPAEQGVKGLKWTRGFQLNKESGVSNEQGVPSEQGVRGLKWSQMSKRFQLNKESGVSNEQRVLS